MTQPKPRKAAQAPPAPQEPTPADPLADLREPDPNPGALLEAPPADPEDPECVVEVRSMVTQETHDEMVAEAVAAWHADTVSLGFLHKGGACGCRYLARQVLRATVPVMTPADLEPHDLEPQDAPQE